MDLKIFNSILFGELQPYSGQNKEEKYFADKLKPSFVMPGNVEEFEEALDVSYEQKFNFLVMGDDSLYKDYHFYHFYLRGFS